MSDYQQAVTDTAKHIGLLDAKGGLVELDSLMIADFATALEDKLDVKIPMAALTVETFSSVASVARMLSELQAKTQSA